MAFQTLIVALLVSGSFVYAAWRLMPQVVRRALAGGLQRLPLPAFLRARLRQVASATGGCGCSGCDSAPLKAKAASTVVQPLVFHPRKP